ncbi:MAG: DEAD/DEAH box helicase [Myxococcales bacterium]|nr:DEAD/DEAH box helicase [Myxococcales bacterium]
MSDVVLRYHKGTLLLDGQLPTVSLPGFVADERVGLIRAPALYYRDVVRALIRAQIPFVDEARNYQEVSLRHHVRQTPFPHQTAGLAAWVKAGKRGVVVLPTGAGKTFVAEMAICDVGRSTLVVVPTLDLMTQWVDRLSIALGTPIGIIGGGAHTLADITVTTYDSAYIHAEKLGNRFGLIVYDEVHHLPGPSIRQSAILSIAPYRLGLTATPERADGAHTELDWLVGPVVYRTDIADLRGEFLADYRVVTIEVDLEPEERERYDEARAIYTGFIRDSGLVMRGPTDWQRFVTRSSRSAAGRRAFRAYLDQKAISLAPNGKINALEALLREHTGVPTIVFTNDNLTAYRVARDFLVPVITHVTDVLERKEILDGLRSGVYRTVVTSRVLNEGVDVPDVGVGIIMSGTGSVREHVQRLGRILRRTSGKQAILYEMITAQTSETAQSKRRRDHDAYR